VYKEVLAVEVKNGSSLQRMEELKTNKAIPKLYQTGSS
jgi:hypothetical protein